MFYLFYLCLFSGNLGHLAVQTILFWVYIGKITKLNESFGQQFLAGLSM